jgi:hypothetical protein
VVPIAIVLTLGGFVAAMIGKRAFRQGAPSHGLATADTHRRAERSISG